MAVTIKDVAALAGVSTSTVSRVCNNNPSISRETREKVQQAIQELGYELPIPQDSQPVILSKNIGVILPPSAQDAYENTFYLKARKIMIVRYEISRNGYSNIKPIIISQNISNLSANQIKEQST